MSSPVLTVIGLDSATFDVVDPMLAAGELPNIGRACREGARGVLRSTTHPLTPHAWSTIVTGVNAGRHGIWDFTERDESGYQLRLVNGSFRRAPAVWDRLRPSGRRLGIVNVPFTWPAPELDGFAIAGFDAAAREQGLTFPASVGEELRRRYGSLELDNRFPLKNGQFDLDLVRRAASQKLEIVEWLAERFDPELLFVVFMAADHVHHICWTDWEAKGLESPVADVYRVLDEAVGRLAELSGPDANLMIVSDHGAGALHGVVNLNAWLAEEGYLTYAQGGGVKGRELLGKALELRRHLPERWRYAAKQRLPKLRDQAQERSDYTVLDWSQTRAFAYGTFGNVVVNVQGREAQGIVEPGEEYDRVRDEIAAKLGHLQGPNGERLVADVHRREDLFHGPELDKVPDLLIEFNDYEWLGKGNLKTRGHRALGRHRDRGQRAHLRREPQARGHRRPRRARRGRRRVALGRARRRRPDAALSARRGDPERPRGPRALRGPAAGAPRRATARVRRRAAAGVRRQACGARGRGRRGGRAAAPRPRLPRVAEFRTRLPPKQMS